MDIRPGLVIAVLILAGCNRTGPKPLPASGPPVLGAWKSIATNGSPVDLTLTFAADGTFQLESIDDHQKMTHASGTYRMSSLTLSSGSSPMVELTYKLFDGKAAPKDASQRLIYDAKGEILHDMLTVAYARADKAPAMKQAMEAAEAKRIAPAMRFDMGPWKKLWEIPLKSGPVPDSEVLAIGSELVTTSDEDVVIVGPGGKIIRTIKAKGPIGSLARGLRNGTPFLAPYTVWGQSLDAYDLAGKRLWTFTPSGSPGIDCVAPIRLDEKNTGLVIGYNGGGGVDIVGSDGKLIKHIELRANVRTVCGARLTSQLPEAVIAVAKGAIAFSSGGATLARFNPPGGCGKVAAMDLDGDGIDEVLTLGDTVSSGLKLFAFDKNGKELWSVKPKSSAMFLQTPIFPIRRGGKSMIAVANAGGIAVLSLKGESIEYLTIDASGATSFSLPGKPDMLVVRRIHGLACYEYR